MYRLCPHVPCQYGNKRTVFVKLILVESTIRVQGLRACSCCVYEKNTNKMELDQTTPSAAHSMQGWCSPGQYRITQQKKGVRGIYAAGDRRTPTPYTFLLTCTIFISAPKTLWRLN